MLWSMTRPGWNPSRRNRNIGTAKSGHGQNNRLVIPARWSDDRVFWEKLRDPIAIERSVGGRDVIVLVEPVIKGFTHCCTPADVLAMLELLAAEDLGDLRLFVLRQPKRKEATLSSVWGRLAYFAQLGSLSGPAVYLEAQKLGRVLHRRRFMSLDAQREFDRLIADGHHAERVPSGYRIQLTLDACRNTQLYRTLLHEIGHQVDYLASVDRPRDALPSGHDDEWDALGERYWQKSTAEKETFAHRYADELAARLRRTGAIPLDRTADLNGLQDQGIDPAWFEHQPD
jgi:hypothetical protein